MPAILVQVQCSLVFYTHVRHAVFSYKQVHEITQFIFIIPAKVLLFIQRQSRGCKKENTEKSSKVRSITVSNLTQRFLTLGMPFATLEQHSRTFWANHSAVTVKWHTTPGRLMNGRNPIYMKKLTWTTEF